MANPLQNLHSKSFKDKVAFLFKDSAFFGITMAVGKLLPVITIPIYTRYFEKQEYSAIDSLTLLGYIFLSLVMIGQDLSGERHFFDAKDDENEKKQIISQSLLIQLINAIIVCSILISINKQLLNFYLRDITHSHAFLWVIVTLPFLACYQFMLNVLKWTYKRTHFFFLVLGVVVLQLSLIFSSIFIFKGGVQGIFIAMFITYVLFALIGMFLCRQYITIKIKTQHITPLYSFGIPYMLLVLIQMLTPSIDRYFLLQTFSLQSLATYILAFRLSLLLQLPVTSFQIAWIPFAYSTYQAKSTQKDFSNILRYFGIVIMLAGTTFCFFIEPIIHIVAGQKYTDSAMYLSPLVFAIIIQSYARITGIGIDLSKKSVYSTISYLLSLAITIIAIMVGVQLLGILGAALGILLGNLSLTIIRTYFAYKTHPLRFDLTTLLHITVVGIIITALHQYIYFAYSTYKYLWSALSIFILMGYSWLFFLKASEKQTLLKLLRKIIN